MMRCEDADRVYRPWLIGRDTGICDLRYVGGGGGTT